MTVYIAGCFESRQRLRPECERLRALGVKVNSSWLDERGEMPHTYLARRDKEEINAADMLIVDTFDVNDRGGREYEAGYAEGIGKPVVLVGPARNVFHAAIRRYDAWPELLAEVEKGWRLELEWR